MISVSAPLGDVAMLRLERPRIGSRGFKSGTVAIEAALAQGRRAVLLDMSAAATLRASDLALIVELAAAALPLARFALVNVAPPLLTALRDTAIDRIVPVFATLERALEAPEIRGALLAQTPAIVLTAGKGSRMAPLTQQVPKPMLDIMGRPVLEHILGHLKSFGVRDVFLNPGHLGPQIPAHFRAGHGLGQSIFYANEGRWRDGRWASAPLGSASTLGRLARDHNCLATDTIVMCGDALVDIDLTAMLGCHRAADADVTIAAMAVPKAQVNKYGIIVADEHGKVSHFQEKPSREEARSTLANTGIYIMSPRVTALLCEQDGSDIAGDLLPSVLDNGGRLQVFSKPFEWVDIGCGRDYAVAWRKALEGRVPVASTDAREVKSGVWAHPSAHVARLSDVEGPAYIGAGASVKKGATLRGPVVLGQNCVAETGSYLRDAILMEGTVAQNGALVDGMIAAAGWAVAHSYADGSEQSREPLEHVVSVEAARDQLWAPARDQINAPLVRAAS